MSAINERIERNPDFRIVPFFPGPVWIDKKTCGVCYPIRVFSMRCSVMQTKARKIQNAIWGKGPPEGQVH
jgi:hypothetical protein